MRLVVPLLLVLVLVAGGFAIFGRSFEAGGLTGPALGVLGIALIGLVFHRVLRGRRE